MRLQNFHIYGFADALASASAKLYEKYFSYGFAEALEFLIAGRSPRQL